MNLCFGLSLFAFVLHTVAAEYPLPVHLGPTNEYGRELQRSMRLLAQSSPQKKRTVKVLFYGQSVTQEIWSVWVGDYLREHFPNANLVITNLAVGYEADILYKPASVDIPGFYPDLLIFQDYGPLDKIEQMIAIARRNTTADILIQTDHINHPEDLTEPTDPLTPGGLPSRAWRNYVALPDIAQRYGGELAHIRDHWKLYLEDFHLSVEELLRDQVHPNTPGNFLMSELIKPYLRPDESFDDQSWNMAETTYKVGPFSDVDWSDDLLTLDFVGNRVDLIADAPSADAVEVRIDGRPPSEFPELYHFTRPDWYPNTYWLSILKISSRTPLLDESWTATVLESFTNNPVPVVRFAVSGSKTGFDGEGASSERFVSNSGRVVIEPEDWLMLYWATAYYPILQPLPVGHEIHWASVFTGKDEFTPTVTDPTLEVATTVAQGLANGQHTLTLRRTHPTTISAIRIFNPLARTQPAIIRSPRINAVALQNESLRLTIGGTTRYVLESSSDSLTWKAETAPRNDPVLTVPIASAFRFFRLRQID